MLFLALWWCILTCRIVYLRWGEWRKGTKSKDRWSAWLASALVQSQRIPFLHSCPPQSSLDQIICSFPLDFTMIYHILLSFFPAFSLNLFFLCVLPSFSVIFQAFQMLYSYSFIWIIIFIIDKILHMISNICMIITILSEIRYQFHIYEENLW